MKSSLKGSAERKLSQLSKTASTASEGARHAAREYPRVCPPNFRTRVRCCRVPRRCSPNCEVYKYICLQTRASATPPSCRDKVQCHAFLQPCLKRIGTHLAKNNTLRLAQSLRYMYKSSLHRPVATCFKRSTLKCKEAGRRMGRFVAFSEDKRLRRRATEGSDSNL